MIIRKIKNRVSNFIWKKKRSKLIKKNIEYIKGKNIPTVLSCNCTGGVMYHELGAKFMSPTINMFMCCEDFIKFCENLDYYLKVDPVSSEHDLNWHLKEKNIDGSNTDVEYPVMLLDDLTLFMVHYHSFEEARDKWNDRKRRVDFNNIRVIATDRDGCTEELKNRFEELPFQKVMFTHLPDKNHKHCFYIKGFENDDQVDALAKDSSISGKRYYDQFDWVDFIVEGEKIH